MSDTGLDTSGSATALADPRTAADDDENAGHKAESGQQPPSQSSFGPMDPALKAHIAEHIAEGTNTRKSQPQIVAQTDASSLPFDRFADRELSWLSFNERVLELAEDPHTPLLERVRFLAIFASNMDEFFMVRVAGLKRRIAAGIAKPSASGVSPLDTLAAISARAHELMERHAKVFRDIVRPALADAGITIVHWNDLEGREQDRLGKFFRKQIFPVLTPLAVDPAHPFPISLACR